MLELMAVAHVSWLFLLDIVILITFGADPKCRRRFSGYATS
jgi:hypothetical protein